MLLRGVDAGWLWVGCLFYVFWMLVSAAVPGVRLWDVVVWFWVGLALVSDWLLFWFWFGPVGFARLWFWWWAAGVAVETLLVLF